MHQNHQYLKPILKHALSMKVGLNYVGPSSKEYEGLKCRTNLDQKEGFSLA